MAHSVAGLGAGDAEFALMLLADARLPSGGHAQSGGLEPALTGGMPEADIPAYLTTRLRTCGTVDAGTAVVALAALRAAPGHLGQTTLAQVQQEWAARTPSQVQRQASATLGRGYLRLVKSLQPEHASTRAAQALGQPCRPIVVAALADILGLDERQLARLVCYDEVQTITAAALKLAPLDPTTTVAWALACRPVVGHVVEAVAGLRDPADIPAPAAPLMELWVHAHATQERRLFSA